jgi:parvulin-like peptidyl-prolyl isomerase
MKKMLLLCKKEKFLLVPLIILSFYLVSCEKISFLAPKEPSLEEEKPPSIKVTGTIIAKVNNIPLTLEDLNDEIKNFNSLVPADQPELKITTREQKIDYLKNEMVRRALLYQEALNRGLDNNEDIQRVLEKTKQDLLVVELVKQETENISATYQEVKDYYETYKEQLREPEERQIREIVVPTEFEAREIYIQLLQGADFATLAKQRSKAASRENAGDLGFITRQQARSKFPEFESEAFSETLEIGKLSNIFKGPDGYYIIKLEGKRGGEQKSFDDMFDDIKRTLTFLKQQQTIENLIDKLSQKAKIEIYEGAIQ